MGMILYCSTPEVRTVCTPYMSYSTSYVQYRWARYLLRIKLWPRVQSKAPVRRKLSALELRTSTSCAASPLSNRVLPSPLVGGALGTIITYFTWLDQDSRTEAPKARRHVRYRPSFAPRSLHESNWMQWLWERAERGMRMRMRMRTRMSCVGWREEKRMMAGS